VRELFGVSWGRARAWIESGKVSVGGAVMTEPTARVPPGSEIDLHERARRPRTAEVAELHVVHVDAQLIVVAKPPGIATVPYDDAEADSLDARVRQWLERTARARAARAGRPSLGVVQRLDKETTGLIVFTRTWLAKQALSSQFRRHSVERRYLAVAHGEVQPRTFRSFLLEDRGDGLRGSARTGGARAPQAREAVTHVDVLDRLAGATLVSCRLETGRTHQIRIHLSEAGHPLVGESVYVRGFAGPAIDAPRLMLHAAELGFVHPTTQIAMHWELPMPADMGAVIERLRR